MGGFLHTTDLRIRALEFGIDHRLKAGVSVSMQTGPALTQLEEEERKVGKLQTQKLLLERREFAFKCAPSGMNMAALVCGAEVNQPGACPQALAKLFTAAKSHSQVDDGSWHSY